MSNPIAYEKRHVRYVPSGKVDWGVFLPASGVLLLSAVAAGMALYGLFAVGWYYTLVTPLVVILPICWLTQTVIRAGRCRWPAVALFVGTLAGLTTYLAYFYVGMVATGGPDVLGRPDLLPSYIRYREQTDVILDHPHPGRQSIPFPAMNWFAAIVELGMILHLTGWHAFRRAQRAYCEACDRRQDQAYCTLRPDRGRTVARWLAEGRLELLLGEPRYDPGRRARFTTVVIESCPKPNDACPTHLAVRDLFLGGCATTYHMFDGGGGWTRVERVALSGADVETADQIVNQPGRHARPWFA